MQHVVVVVEPHTAARAALVVLLEHEGYRVIALERPQDAADAVAQGSVDVLLVGREVRGEDAECVAEAIRAASPEIRIVFMSCQSDPPSRVAAPLLLKPLDVPSLLSLLASPREDEAFGCRPTE